MDNIILHHLQKPEFRWHLHQVWMTQVFVDEKYILQVYQAVQVPASKTVSGLGA